MEPFPITPRQIFGLWLAAVVWVVGAGYVLRRAQRLPFFQPKFPDAELRENWISGASSVGLFGRLARSNNCVWFVLTKSTLHIGRHFPFNTLVPHFIARLDFDIPVAAISSVEEQYRTLGGAFVRISWEVTEPARGIARTESVDLFPRRRDHFVAVLREKARAARKERGV